MRDGLGQAHQLDITAIDGEQLARDVVRGRAGEPHHHGTDVLWRAIVEDIFFCLPIIRERTGRHPGAGPRRDGVDGHANPLELASHRYRHAYDASLRGRIVHLTDKPDIPGLAAGVDDPTVDFLARLGL